jgi:hypothetical protein
MAHRAHLASRLAAQTVFVVIAGLAAALWAGASAVYADSGPTASSLAEVTGTPTAALPASGTGTTTAACPSEVVISLLPETVHPSSITINFTHTGKACPSARAAVLHVHQNLVATAAAASNNAHQANEDFSVGPYFGTSVTVALLTPIDGMCVDQVDTHAAGATRGRFIPLAGCTAAPSSSQTSSAPVSPPPLSSTSASIITEPPSSVDAPIAIETTTPAVTTSASVVTSAVNVASTPVDAASTLANTGPPVIGSALAAVGLIGLGILTLWLGTRFPHRPRRH